MFGWFHSWWCFFTGGFGVRLFFFFSRVCVLRYYRNDMWASVQTHLIAIGPLFLPVLQHCTGSSQSEETICSLQIDLFASRLGSRPDLGSIGDVTNWFPRFEHETCCLWSSARVSLWTCRGSDSLRAPSHWPDHPETSASMCVPPLDNVAARATSLTNGVNGSSSPLVGSEFLIAKTPCYRPSVWIAFLSL